MPNSSKNTSAKKPAPDREKLLADLKVLIEDATALTANVADDAQEAFAEKAAEIQEQIREALSKLKDHGEAVKEKSKESIETVETLIRDNPWKSLGIAVVAGILIDRLLRD